MLREFDDDGFVIMTDARTQKIKDLVNINNVEILIHLAGNNFKVFILKKKIQLNIIIVFYKL